MWGGVGFPVGLPPCVAHHQAIINRKLLKISNFMIFGSYELNEKRMKLMAGYTIVLPK